MRSFEIFLMSTEQIVQISLICAMSPVWIESMKTTSMETVSTVVLDKDKEHCLLNKDKAEKWYDASRQLHMSKYEQNEDILFIMSNLQPTV